MKEEIKENRRIGNTTRAADYFIQMIFNNPGEDIEIKDHFDHPASHNYLFHKIINRLNLEHSRRLFIKDSEKCTIMLPQGEAGYISFTK